MKMEMQLSGVDGILKTLKSLPAEVVSKRGGPVKLALAKGARLLRNEVKKNLRAVIDSDESTGLLEKNIIASRGKQPTGGNGERYLVRVKRRTYVDREGKPVTTLKTANILEYGSEKQTAKPFIRPAAISKASQTINVVTTDLKKRLDKVVKDLARVNK
jgi:HK97 gp10 family phage protein